MNQKEFVKASIMANMTAEGGQLNFEACVSAITQGFLTGDCPHKNEAVRTDEKAARSYAKAVVNNYLKKDKDLNGGTKYVPENPRGPRGDSKLKELNKVIDDLVAIGADSQMIEAVAAAAEARKGEIEAAKGTKVKTLDEIKADLVALGVAI